VLGSALLAAPRLSTPLWIGRRSISPASALLTRATGARDVGLAVGLLAALSGGRSLRPWLAAGVLADAADVIATVMERDSLPRTAVPLLISTGGVGVVMGIAALAGGENSAPVPA
jgi:hypothetical protein